MQIVRDLAGYTLGRSDLVRRAMAKKKASVMDAERQNFVYGNKEQNIPGCVANGIPEDVANHIYDEMIDFAKYAFNKSHAAAYAVVSYQTAYLKYYHPVEFMAALMTSVIDNSAKVSDYILVIRRMGIALVPPDINGGERDFSVLNGKICFALSAIKSIGRTFIDSMVEERKLRGPFRTLEDFLERMQTKDLNRRAIENLIKAGALDCLPGNRRQKMNTFPMILDRLQHDKRGSITGQMSLMDLLDGEQKSAFSYAMPDLPEYDKSTMLAFEKEVLGIYVSGHPLEENEALLRKNVTAYSTDFVVDEETNTAKVLDKQRAVIGGMITAKTVKTTKNGDQMAFVTIEDMTGSVEVLFFPRTYDQYRTLLTEERRILVDGRVSLGEEAQGKLICQKVIPFEDVPREVWIAFDTYGTWSVENSRLYAELPAFRGRSRVIVYLKENRSYMPLPVENSVNISPEFLDRMKELFGPENVRVVEKSIEKVR